MDQFATHQEYWELDSNNNFENSIVAVLRAHFATAPPSGTPQAGISSGTSLPASE
jgi:hypothetical protein